ncbi:MAG: hypothetical protein COW51_01025, partial [Candidatus Moranbacteria bacterium CG17_big_fil_post_rev_8_21_14_2_50_44_12]
MGEAKRRKEIQNKKKEEAKMSESKRPVCATCPYWNPVDPGPDGECRADHPHPILMPLQTLLDKKPQIGVNSFFPKTRPDIWCGRHPGFMIGEFIPTIPDESIPTKE